MSTLRPFHLAIPVDDLDAARHFYGGVMACPEGRSDAQWIDFDFFGHQLVVHVVLLPSPSGEGVMRPDLSPRQVRSASRVGTIQLEQRQSDRPHPNPAVAGGPSGGRSSSTAPEGEGLNVVDGHDVPVPHFGVVLTPDAFDALAARLRGAGTLFVIEPTVRFAGLPGEQRTMFLRDPAGNALEFKAFADDGQLFAR